MQWKPGSYKVEFASEQRAGWCGGAGDKAGDGGSHPEVALVEPGYSKVERKFAPAAADSRARETQSAELGGIRSSNRAASSSSIESAAAEGTMRAASATRQTRRGADADPATDRECRALRSTARDARGGGMARVARSADGLGIMGTVA